MKYIYIYIYISRKWKEISGKWKFRGNEKKNWRNETEYRGNEDEIEFQENEHEIKFQDNEFINRTVEMELLKVFNIYISHQYI